MNKKRLENDTLDKDLANCEYYLNKVLRTRNGNSEKPSTTLRLGQNFNDTKLRTSLKSGSNLKSVTRLNEQGQIRPQSKSNLPTNRTDSCSKDQKKVVHKEILNNGTTVEVTVKTKTPESPRQSCKDAPIEQPESISEPPNSKCSHFCKEKKTRHNDPSWGQLLQAFQFQELHKNSKKSNSCPCTANKHDPEHDKTDIPVETDKRLVTKNLASKSKFDENLDTTTDHSVRRVNILFKKLSKSLNKKPCEDSETNTLLNSIEYTLNRLHSDERSNRKTNSVAENRLLFSPLKIHEFEEDRPVLLQPERTNPKTITTQTSWSEMQPKDVIRSEMDTETKAVVKMLQGSCEKLEATCSEIKATCEELRQDKAALKQELLVKNQQLETKILKEKEYFKILETFKQNFNNMTKKSEENLKTISKLTIENTKFREDIRSLDQLQLTNEQLSSRIKEVELINERFGIEIEILKLENEKNNFNLKKKQSGISKYKENIRNIYSFLQNNLKDIEKMKNDHLINEDKQITITKLNLKLVENKPIMICSSPSTSNKSPESSWEHISKISHDIGSQHTTSTTITTNATKNYMNEREFVREENKRFSTIYEVESNDRSIFEQTIYDDSECNQSIALNSYRRLVDTARDDTCDVFNTLLEED